MQRFRSRFLYECTSSGGRIGRGRTAVVLACLIACGLLAIAGMSRFWQDSPPEASTKPAAPPHVDARPARPAAATTLYASEPSPWHHADDDLAAVREMARFAWRNYVDYCGWQGGNELAPLTRCCSLAPDSVVGPRQLLTAVDSLDTLALMGLRSELAEARRLIDRMFRPRQSAGLYVSVFETNIRLLGGFLGAYSLTKDRRYAELAAEVADSLDSAFIGLSEHMVPGWVKLFYSYEDIKPNLLLLAEAGSMYLEFTYLSEITGNETYADWARLNQAKLLNVSTRCGLYPNTFNPKGERLANFLYGTNGGSASFYEYLLKRCLLDARPEPGCHGTYAASLDNIMTRLTVKVGPSTETGYLCSSPVIDPCKNPTECDMEHIACFLGGTYALAYLQNPRRRDWLQFAENITRTCYMTYVHSPTGLGPEHFRFDSKSGKLVAYPGSDYYLLRPEIVESIYYLYHVTGNQMYRDWGRRIAHTLNSTARTAHGFSGLRAMMGKPEFDNRQQSFFIAETLKYLYLLLSPARTLPLDKWLFTTGAHVMPIRNHSMRKRMHGNRRKVSNRRAHHL